MQFLLLGGPAERERNDRLKARVQVPLLDPGCDNTVRHFAALLSHCDVVVTGDTLAMHLSLALGKRTVVLFGPTSAAEIELYGLGEKVVPDMTCLSCYKTSCDFVPNCMDLISHGHGGARGAASTGGASTVGSLGCGPAMRVVRSVTPGGFRSLLGGWLRWL